MDLHRNTKWLFGFALALVLALPSVASAYSVRVHVYLANAIHDELNRNAASGGPPVLRLMSPEGAPPAHVELDETDARAIMSPEYLPFFRGGAIGPDNTVMTGLTDPSHAPDFSPFQQCTLLYEEAIRREEARIDAGENPDTMDLSERAYALGCFLHGISDNNAHHLVNFFTGQTFTLHPVDQATESGLRFSLVNVVRHIVTEGSFERGLEANDAAQTDRTRQGVTAAPIGETYEEMQATFHHRIAIDLVRSVYFDPENSETGLWERFAGDLVEAKREALRRALRIPHTGRGDGDDIIEAMINAENPWETDRAVIGAYVEYLRGSGMAPADYLLFLPAIVADVQHLYAIVNEQGTARAEAMDDEYIIRPSRVLERRMLRNAFFPRDAADDLERDGTGQSRFDVAMELKYEELDQVVSAYIEAVQGISNLNIEIGLQHSTRDQRLEALASIIRRLDTITDLDYTILFSETTTNIINTIGFLKQALDGIFALATQHIKELVLARARAYLDELQEQYGVLKAEAERLLEEQTGISIQQLRDDVAELRSRATDAAKQRALDELGLHLERGHDAFNNFQQSVLYMNTWNSIAGAMAMPGVVDPGVYASGDFGGPKSFDAAYQLEYNQLALCNGNGGSPDLARFFYPCGRSAGEMLQPDYRTCAAIPAAEGVLDPPVECHGHTATEFAADPADVHTLDYDDCHPGSLDDHIVNYSSDSSGRLGSYTLSFPPAANILGDETPTCWLSGYPIATGDEAKEDGFGVIDEPYGPTACAVSPGRRDDGSDVPAFLVSALVCGALLRRRRRV